MLCCDWTILAQNVAKPHTVAAFEVVRHALPAQDRSTIAPEAAAYLGKASLDLLVHLVFSGARGNSR